jgi:carboxylesterase
MSGRQPTVLCLHGYGGVPREVELGIRAASAVGLASVAPLLPGHGTFPKDTAELRFDDWLAGVRVEFDRQRARGPVILLGLSLGSLLATALYLEAPGDVLGLVLLSSAFWLSSPLPGLALDLVDRLRLPDFGMPKTGGPDLGDEEARRTHLSYEVQPIHAAISVLRSGERLRRQLHRIHCPTLLLHGALDRVCPVAGAWKAAHDMNDADVRVVIFPHSHHILTRDVEATQVGLEIEAFLRRVSRVEPPAAVRTSGAAR